jgi:hypothetical protein
MIAAAEKKSTLKSNGRLPHPPITTVATVATPEASTKSPESDHGAGGRFAPGNKAAAGNPFHRAVAARRKALLDAVSDEDVATVGRKLKEMALAGDVAAAKVLLSYVVGKPAPTADPDRLDLDELAVLMAGPLKLELVAQAFEGVDPAVALDFLRKTLSGTTFEAVMEAARGDRCTKNLYTVVQMIHKARAAKT